MGQSLRAEPSPRRRRSRGQRQSWLQDRTPLAVPLLTVLLAALLLASLAWSRHCFENRPLPEELVLMDSPR